VASPDRGFRPCSAATSRTCPLGCVAPANWLQQLGHVCRLARDPPKPATTSRACPMGPSYRRYGRRAGLWTTLLPPWAIRPRSQVDLPLSLDVAVPFTRGQALASGTSAAQLRRRDYVRLFHNVYIGRGSALSLASRARGALLIAPSTAVVSHHTAAQLWGGSVPESSALHGTISRAQSFDVRGVRTHESDRPRDVTTRGGIRLTTPEQTFVDLGSSLDLVQLVVLGDRLVATRGTTPTELKRVADQWRGDPSRARVQGCGTRPRGSRLAAGEPATNAHRAGRSSGTDCQLRRP
jgi:hypothetical protein